MNRVYVTDCEGPVSLNDNAFEAAAEFIPRGDEFFQKVSKFDDILADEIKRPGYNAGDTLKLIVPFLIAYGLTDQKLVEFSTKTLKFVPGALDALEFARASMPSYIISTSYRHYIEALCESTGFPLKNTYYTELTFDSEILEDERRELFRLKDEIIEGDFETLDEIFFQIIPEMEIGKVLEKVKTVGGDGKRLALMDILARHGLREKSAIYVGDSITDVEPLRALNGTGLAVAFNGNQYAIREAEVVVISEDARALMPLVDLYSRFSREYVLEFIKAYNENPERALESFRLNFTVVDEFRGVFRDGFPTLTLKDDYDELVRESIRVRKKIRGEKIGALG